VHVVQEPVDVHRGPSKGANTGAESTFEVIDMRSQEGTSVRADLVNDTDALTHNILELVVVVLELLFLEKDDLGRLRNINSNAGKAFGLADERQDLRVKVDVELEILEVPDEQGGL